MNYEKIYEVESLIRELSFKVIERFSFPKNYFGLIYDEEIIYIKNKMLKLHEDSQEYQNYLIEIEKIFESYAKLFSEDVEKAINDVSSKLSEKLNLSYDIIKKRINNDIKKYINDIDNLFLYEYIEKIYDYLDEVNFDYFMNDVK